MSEAEVSETHDPLKSVADALEAAVQAAKDGASNAREAAANMMPEAGGVMSQIAYKTCYAISYGLVFPSALIAQSIPKDNAFVHGLIDGAHAAQDMATDLRTRKAAAEPSTVE